MVIGRLCLWQVGYTSCRQVILVIGRSCLWQVGYTSCRQVILVIGRSCLWQVGYTSCRQVILVIGRSCLWQVGYTSCRQVILVIGRSCLWQVGHTSCRQVILVTTLSMKLNKRHLERTKLLTVQKEKKASSLISALWSADRLNFFYSYFNNRDNLNVHQSKKSELIKRIAYEAPIKITEAKVYKVLRTNYRNKATRPEKISERIVKQCTTSLVYIVHCNIAFSMYL